MSSSNSPTWGAEAEAEAKKAARGVYLTPKEDNGVVRGIVIG
jgi:hypothetical protein